MMWTNVEYHVVLSAFMVAKVAKERECVALWHVRMKFKIDTNNENQVHLLDFGFGCRVAVKIVAWMFGVWLGCYNRISQEFQHFLINVTAADALNIIVTVNLDFFDSNSVFYANSKF